MKKRIFFYIILAIILGVFCYFNYNYEADVNDIEIISSENKEGVITLSGKTKGKVYSVSTENAGDIIYVTVKVKNSIGNEKSEFTASVSNKNNSVKQVVLKDKKNTRTVYENDRYGKPDVLFDSTQIFKK